MPPLTAGKNLEVTYRCWFPVRGVYEFGPASISSAFPVGLVKTKIKFRQVETMAVAPATGRLTRSWTRLLHSDRHGEIQRPRQQRTQVGDFYAIRPWATGDNPSLVHWRSTARHGELMVRQNEQRQDRKLMLVLDFHVSSLGSDIMELMLSWVATILRKSVEGSSPLAVGLFGSEPFIKQQLSRGDLAKAMETLAVIQPADDNGLEVGIQKLLTSLAGQANVIVISTRSREAASLRLDLPNLSAKWIDVSREDISVYFQNSQADSAEFAKQISRQVEGRR